MKLFDKDGLLDQSFEGVTYNKKENQEMAFKGCATLFFMIILIFGIIFIAVALFKILGISWYM